MKKLFLILCLFSMTSHAENVKLACQMDFIQEDNVSPIKRFSELVTFEIMDIGISVSTKVIGDLCFDTCSVRDEVTNNSTPNKWSVINKTTLDGSVFTTTLTIDRNTGLVNSDLFAITKDKNVTYWKKIGGSGSCQKVDAAKKMF